MLAAVMKGVGQVALEDVPEPAVQKPTDVIVGVTATTICTSDVHIVDGYFPPSPPFILGHEFIGVVRAAGGAVTRFKEGDRVAVPPVPFCGACDNCRAGKYGQCMHAAPFGSGATWGDIPGGLAGYVRVPHADSCMMKIPDQITDEQSLFVGDMLTTGYFAADNCALKPGDTLAVFGAGPVGLCAVHAARLSGLSRVILIDMLENRLELGLKMGATDIINAAEEDVLPRIMELTGGRGVNAAIEAVGHPAAVSAAAQSLGVGGVLSVVGLFPGNIDFPIQTLLMKNATMKIGLASLDNMRRLMTLVEAGKLDATPLITHQMPLADFERAYDTFKKKEDNIVKVVLKP